MRYIASWSGGKDSTASIILAHLHGEPLQTIIYSEVMYDKTRGISGENPMHQDFIINTAKPVFEDWGYEVKILHAERDYLDVFNRRMLYARKHQENVGKRYGFPISRLCSVKRDCKIAPIEKYLKEVRKTEGVIQYIGIAGDERVRLESMRSHPEKISLLEKYHFTEDMAKDLCERFHLLSPIYYEMGARRSGCWMCPNARVCEHAYIKTHAPQVWQEFVSLESATDLAKGKWNVFGDTLQERDQKVDEYLIRSQYI